MFRTFIFLICVHVDLNWKDLIVIGVVVDDGVMCLCGELCGDGYECERRKCY